MLNAKTKKISIFMICLIFFFAIMFLTGCGSSKDEKVTDIQVSTINNKVYINEEFNTDNVLVIAEYSDGSLKTILNKFVKFSPIDTSTVGIKILVVSYGGKIKSLQIEVIKPEFNFNIVQTENGTITPKNAVVVYGENQEFILTPNEGYELDSILLDGVIQPNPIKNSNGEYIFIINNVTKEHTLKVTFKIKTYQITTQVGLNGTITPEDPKVNYNENATFTLIPNVGYLVDELKIDNVLVNLQNDENLTDNKDGSYNYIINNVTTTHNISVTFIQGTYGLIYQGLNINGASTDINSTIVSYAISGYIGSEPNIIIPKRYNGKPVTTLGNTEFQNFRSSIINLTIPSSITTIGNILYDATPLKSIKVDINNEHYKDDNGRALLTKDGKTLIAYANKSGSTYVIPSSVTAIGDCGFQKGTFLTHLTIPSSVITIGNFAFWECSSLADITIPNSVQTIGDKAFIECSKLQTVIFEPNSKLQTIGDGAFYNCSSLTNITIPSSVILIGDGAFYNCSSLTEVTIDSIGIAKIASINSANYLIKYAKTIYIKNGITQISTELQNNYAKQVNSDKDGYVKYTLI